MLCPHCGASETSVADTRLAGDAVRRRRLCGTCERRFTTYERFDQGLLFIRKRDGSREPFDRVKLMAGLERAAIKRPIEREQLEALVDRIAAQLRAAGGTPAAEEVGALALRGMRELDPVAYVRFASVYRKFADIAEFERELERLETVPALQHENLFEPTGLGAASRDSVRPQGHSPGSPRTPDTSVEGAGLAGVSDDKTQRAEE